MKIEKVFEDYDDLHRINFGTFQEMVEEYLEDIKEEHIHDAFDILSER